MKAIKFIENFHKAVKYLIAEVKKGPQNGLKAAQKLAKKAQSSCKNVDKILTKQIIKKMSTVNVNNLVKAFKNVCKLIVSDEKD
uniref:Uncharacterized protein n=1 Tax=Megaselia scalaris TaxID=36166 RepID=T1GDI5_MEGSC